MIVKLGIIGKRLNKKGKLLYLFLFYEEQDRNITNLTIMEKTTQEKIDYIYNHIKTERKLIYWRRIFKTLMYLFFIAYIAYFYLYWFAKLKNSIIEAVKPNINSEKIVDWLKENFSEIKNKLLKKSESEEITPEISY